MRDVIQKVIATEAEARRVVAAAKARADAMLSEARKKGQDLITQTGQKARTEADDIVQAAVQAAEREKQELLARAAAEIEAQVRLDERVRELAVTGVIRCVCGER